ncbi:MAG: Mur ligase family protein, partial [bacterium]
ALGIKPFNGYRPENIDTAAPQLAIIGNVIRKDNPEAQEVLRRNIPYHSMPSALASLFLAGRTPIVIAGTHGKTTSSNMAAWLLEAAGESPGFLIGGVGQNFGKSYSLGHGHFFVVEGDEYDSAFFDKGPKFWHYMPQALMITSIEFDHADIYRDVDQIYSSFERLAQLVPPDGIVVANAQDALAMKAAFKAQARIVTYAASGEADYRPEKIEVSEEGTRFSLLGFDYLLPMWGEYNLQNAIGVLVTLLESGIQPRNLVKGLASFKGVKRRQELAGEVGGVSVIDDFAHHPTAVAKTIAGIRERFPTSRIWAIFEPRSNTSRRNIFQRQFTEALSSADKVILASPYKPMTIPAEERFDSHAVAAELMRKGTDAHHIEDVDHIVEFAVRGAESGDVMLVMSNGSFGGVIQKLLAALAAKRNA